MGRRSILVHDFAGHAFPAQLSRELAGRGLEVVHAFCGSVTAGQGDLRKRPDDPEGLRFVDTARATFERYQPARRLASELRYGRAVARLVHDVRPDVVLSANTPLITQAVIWRAARRTGARRVFWVQDLLGTGTRLVLRGRSAVLGSSVGVALERLETLLLRGADAHVVIADDFVAELRRRGIAAPITVVENWAPLDEIPPGQKENDWSRPLGLDRRPFALYSGTLGLKHDVEHLRAAATALEGIGDVVVVSEGLGRAALEDGQRRASSPNLHLHDYVEHAVFPDVLAASDVCLALLEPDAGRFSVPSKILAYLAAARPVVGAIPSSNLAARVIRRSGAGVVVEPGDHAGFAKAVRELLEDPERARSMGAAGRRYAEEHFDIGRIGDRFVEVLTSGAERRAQRAPRQATTAMGVFARMIRSFARDHDAT